MNKLRQSQLNDINVNAGAPTVNDDETLGFGIGSKWFDTNTGSLYICEDATATAAVWTVTAGSGSGTVLSVTGLDTDNSDPTNPVVQIAVDGVTVTGDGTPGNPLVAPAGLDVPGFDGFISNGKIETSVASNNITVALKTMAGADPSGGDPVRVRINNTLHTITSALSVTVNAGASWFGSGSSLFATKEVDYFVYLGFNATDGVTIGFSRTPKAKKYGDFSVSITDYNYGAISDISNAVSTDQYRVIGRFNAILSAGVAFNWSIPATSIIENRPIFNTRKLEYTPSLTGSGSMTWTATLLANYYQIINEMVFLTIVAEGTTGGTPDTRLIFSIPIPVDTSGANNGIGCAIRDGSGSDAFEIAGILGVDGSVQHAFGKRYDGANFGIGTLRRITGEIYYSY